MKDAVQNVREVSQLLRPSILDDFGLNASLRWLAEGFAERTGKEVRITSSFTGRLDGTAETQIFRIAQEALTNIARHADATEVDVDFSSVDDQVVLEVRDNGRGMNTEVSCHGSGMVGMRARARAIGASLVVRSRPGNGVSVLLKLPISKKTYVSQDSHSVGR